MAKKSKFVPNIDGKYNWRAALSDAIAAKGLTSKDFAEHAGVQPQFIYDTLNGTEPRINAFAAVASAAGMSMDELYYGPQAATGLKLQHGDTRNICRFQTDGRHWGPLRPSVTLPNQLLPDIQRLMLVRVSAPIGQMRDGDFIVTRVHSREKALASHVGVFSLAILRSRREDKHVELEAGILFPGQGNRVLLVQENPAAVRDVDVTGIFPMLATISGTLIASFEGDANYDSGVGAGKDDEPDVS